MVCPRRALRGATGPAHQPALLESLERDMIPLGRLGTPEEAADGVYLLCSPESNYISGQVVTVGGGITF